MTVNPIGPVSVLHAGALVLLLLANAGAAGAQGSSGGSLGKTDQSLSGGQPKEAKPGAAPRAKQEKAKGCPNIVGMWSSWASGLFGKNDTTFRSDGSATHNPGGAGRWWCVGGQLHIDWGGSGKPGPVRFSADGKKMFGTDGGVHMSKD